MNILFTEAIWLRDDNNEGYGLLPIPNERDDEISTLIRQWMALQPVERRETSTSICDNQRPVLSAYSERMATRAVRESSRELLVLGLIAQGLDGWRIDWRDNVMLLALFYDASKRLGISPEQLFSDVSRYLPLNVSHALTSFLKRSPENRTLEAMEYSASSDRDGFRYKRDW